MITQSYTLETVPLILDQLHLCKNKVPEIAKKICKRCFQLGLYRMTKGFATFQEITFPCVLNGN